MIGHKIKQNIVSSNLLYIHPVQLGQSQEGAGQRELQAWTSHSDATTRKRTGERPRLEPLTLQLSFKFTVANFS